MHTVRALGCLCRLSKARAILRLAKDTEQQLQVAFAHSTLVQIIELVALCVGPKADGNLCLVLVVGVGSEVRVPELVDNLVVYLRGRDQLPY